ncbi:hypothetical protein ACFL6K_03700, partial [Candidatus Latescibacterota bacterium]
MICKLCGDDKKLVDSHIIPHSFIKLTVNGNPNLKIYSKNQNEFPQRAPIGFYDKELVCEDCERKFSPWDDYAKTLLIDKLINYKHKNEDYEYYLIDSYDYKTLKLFFLSILWRSSATKHKVFSQVNLGPYEKTIASMIKEENPGEKDDFATIIQKYDDSYLSKIIQQPFKVKLSRINFYHFYINGFIFWMKVDGRNTPKNYSINIVQPDSPLIISGG